MYHACTMDAQAKFPSHGNPLGFRKKMVTLLDLCVSSLRRGHANLLCIVLILTGSHLQIPLNRGPSRTLEQEFSVTRPLNVQRRGPKLGQDRIVHTHSCTRCRSWLRSQATGALACRSHSGYSTGQNTESSDSGCKNLQMNSARPRV